MRSLGFGRVEVVLVIAIIGLLAVVGFPQLISPHSRSVDAQLKADLRNAAAAVDSYYAKRGTYPASIEDLEEFGFQPSDGVKMTITVVGPGSYTITAASPEGTRPNFTLNSSTGWIN